MFNQISLLVLLLAPVVSYVAGAIMFSVIELVRKDAKQLKYHQHFTYKNGH